jgi:hypothetical protein
MRCLKKSFEVHRLSSNKKYLCETCSREITKEDYDNYDGLCWECWDDQLIQESDSMFSELI